MSVPLSLQGFPDSPYPGLRPFDEDEWSIFFGRERFIERIVERLRQEGVLLVHGDSGAGKSSLIRAGVLPLLARSPAEGDAAWRSVITRPGNRPLEALAGALSAAAGGSDRTVEFMRALSHGAAAAGEIAALLDISDRSPLCLVVDQFEELFESARGDGGVQATRIAQLLKAALGPAIPGFWVVLTMRSEYLGRCAAIPGLAEVVGEHQYLLPRMSRSELLRAIQEPARQFGGRVDAPFACWLVDRTANDQDQLPLVQHALAYLTGRHAAADATSGTVAGGWTLGDDPADFAVDPRELLSQHADALFLAARKACGLPGDQADKLGDALFRALTDTSSEGLAIRRPQSFADLVAVAGHPREHVDAFLRPFRAEGHTFVTPRGDGPLGDGDRIDISHESLLRNWGRIADPAHGLRAREFEDGLRWKVLLQQALEHKANPEARRLLPPTYAANRQHWLGGLSEAWARRHGGGWTEVRELVDASLLYARRGKTYKILSALLGAAVVFLVAAVLLSKRHTQYLESETVRLGEKAGELERKAGRLEQEAKRLAMLTSQLRADRDEAQARLDRSDKDTNQLLYIIRNLQEELDAVGSQAIQSEVDAVQQLRVDLLSRQKPVARVYFHIAEESQRDAAAVIEARLETMTIDGQSPNVPGIEFRPKSPSRSEFRCFAKEECKGEARVLVAAINRLLAQPRLVLADFSREFEGSPDIRPRHYEVWFAPGEVVPATPPAAH